MQLVIDLSDKDYKEIMFCAEHHPRDLTFYERKIVNGTPLPEHHGDLKDVDTIIDRIKSDQDWDGDAVAEAIVRIIENASTIIESESRDKE